MKNEDQNLQPQANNVSTEIPPINSEKKYSRKIIILIGILVALAIMVLFMGVAFQRTQKRAAHLPPSEPANMLLATVGTKKIYRNDVKIAASKQYLASAINNDVLKTFLGILVERAILDSEAEKLKITITDKEIETRLKEMGGKGNSEVVKYNLIKEKIMRSQIKSVTAYTIGFWIASFDYPQIPEYAVQRADGVKALTAIEQKLKAGEVPLGVAKYAYDNFPSLKTIIALNGYIYEKAQDQSALTSPKNYTLDPKDFGKPYNDDEVTTALSTIKPNEVVKVERKDGSGGTVIKAVTVNSKGFASYEDFLATRKKELITINNSL